MTLNDNNFYQIVQFKKTAVWHPSQGNDIRGLIFKPIDSYDIRDRNSPWVSYADIFVISCNQSTYHTSLNRLSIGDFTVRRLTLSQVLEIGVTHNHNLVPDELTTA